MNAIKVLEKLRYFRLLKKEKNQNKPRAPPQTLPQVFRYQLIYFANKE